MSHQKLTMMRSTTTTGDKRFCASSTSPSSELVTSMKSKPSLLLQRQTSAQSEESLKNIKEYTPELTLENKSAILRSQIKNGQANLMKESQSVENLQIQCNKKKLVPSRSTQQVSPSVIIPSTRDRPQSSLPYLEGHCFNSSSAINQRSILRINSTTNMKHNYQSVLQPLSFRSDYSS